MRAWVGLFAVVLANGASAVRINSPDVSIAHPAGTHSHGGDAAPSVGAGQKVVPWSLDTMIDALKLARAAYCDLESLSNWTCPSCYGDLQVTAVIQHDLSESLAYVAYDASKDRVVVSFRGSVNIPNWVADLTFFKGDLEPMLPNVDGVKVHTGFRDSYHELQPGVRAAVSTLLADHPGAEVLVTGHSLGAAQAGMASVDLSVGLNVSNTAFTFGQPRIGDSGFASLYGSEGRRVGTRTWRAVNEADIVPHLPLKPIMDFHHTATEVWRAKPDLIHLPYTSTACDGSGEDPHCSDSIKADLDFVRGVYDHTHYWGVITGCNEWPKE